MRRHITYSAQAPVEYADENFHRRTCDGEKVLHAEELSRQRHVRKEADGKCCSRERQADDCEVLHVPPVRLISARPLSVRHGKRDDVGVSLLLRTFDSDYQPDCERALATVWSIYNKGRAHYL